MRIKIEAPSAITVSRVAQLTQRTNQLNMTTRRYTETDIEHMISSPDVRVATVRVEDRFGDNGIVGVMIAKLYGEAWELDTFLLSCRVIGRTVETAMLAWLCEQAERAGAIELVGEFIATSKNKPAAKIYPDHGFQPCESQHPRSDAAAESWRLDLDGKKIQMPDWFESEGPSD